MSETGHWNVDALVFRFSLLSFNLFVHATLVFTAIIYLFIYSFLCIILFFMCLFNFTCGFVMYTLVYITADICRSSLSQEHTYVSRLRTTSVATHTKWMWSPNFRCIVAVASGAKNATREWGRLCVVGGVQLQVAGDIGMSSRSHSAATARHGSWTRLRQHHQVTDAVNWPTGRWLCVGLCASSAQWHLSARGRYHGGRRPSSDDSLFVGWLLNVPATG